MLRNAVRSFCSGLPKLAKTAAEGGASKTKKLSLDDEELVARVVVFTATVFAGAEGFSREYRSDDRALVLPVLAGLKGLCIGCAGSSLLVHVLGPEVTGVMILCVVAGLDKSNLVQEIAGRK